MLEPYLGQVEIFGFGFPPKGWATCDGKLLPIAQNQALFELIGTTFGGDGRLTFALPDLRSRLPIGQGNDYPVGTATGDENHTLLISETPYHGHGAVQALNNPVLADNTNVHDSTVGLTQSFAKDKAGNPLPLDIYVPDANPGVPMAAASIASFGGRAHANVMPYNTLNMCIALVGALPAPN